MSLDPSKKNSGLDGRRYHSFYQGYWARRRGEGNNPYPPGAKDHRGWRNGWAFAEGED